MIRLRIYIKNLIVPCIKTNTNFITFWYLFLEQPIPSDPGDHEVEDLSSPIFSLGPFYHNSCGK